MRSATPLGVSLLAAMAMASPIANRRDLITETDLDIVFTTVYVTAPLLTPVATSTAASTSSVSALANDSPFSPNDGFGDYRSHFHHYPATTDATSTTESTTDEPSSSTSRVVLSTLTPATTLTSTVPIPIPSSSAASTLVSSSAVTSTLAPSSSAIRTSTSVSIPAYSTPTPSSSSPSSSSSSSSSKSTSTSTSSVFTPAPVASTSSKTTSTTAIATPTAANSYQAAVLAHHNVHRTNHSAPAIQWSDSLAKIAADEAAVCIYAHNVTGGGGGYGQNIAAGVAAENISAIITDLFYNGEVNWFNGLYGQVNPDFTNFEHWGHFSQIVWKGTGSVGCATHDCGPGGLANVGGDVAPIFTVCNYEAPGNMGGEYGDNIGEPIGMATVEWNYAG